MDDKILGYLRQAIFYMQQELRKDDLSDWERKNIECALDDIGSVELKRVKDGTTRGILLGKNT